MTSQSRAQRPAATDYFNPAEQLELLNNIKAKVEKNVKSAPQQSQEPSTMKVPGLATQSSTTMKKPIDYKAQELSLREKLEKAKADREAKAKEEAAVAALAHSQPLLSPTTTTPTSHLNESHPAETASAPPPPQLLNANSSNNVPALFSAPAQTQPNPYGSAWAAGMPFPPQPPMPGFPQPSFSSFPPFSQFGMPFAGNPAQPFPQWPFPAPGPISDLPLQQTTQKQASLGTAPTPQPLQPTNQNPPNRAPVNQTPPNQTVVGQTGCT